MLIFVYSDLFLLLGQVLPRCFQLLSEKLGGVFGFLLSQLQILTDEQIGQLSSNLLCEVGIVRRIKDVERCNLISCIAYELNLDILTHPLDQLIVIYAAAFVGIQVELINNMQ